jgi:hypothetical protein
MAEAWPTDIPFKLLGSGAAVAPGESVIRSPTDSGLQRQRAATSVALDTFNGSIRMTWSEFVIFDAWRKGLAGGAFDWPGHPSGVTKESRFVAGAQGAAARDSATVKWLVPVSIEVLE